MDGPQTQQRQIRLIMGARVTFGPATRRDLFCAHHTPYLRMHKEDDMPKTRFALILLSVLIAAGASVWLLSLGGPGIMVAALPAFLIAAVAIKFLGR